MFTCVKILNVNNNNNSIRTALNPRFFVVVNFGAEPSDVIKWYNPF